MVDALVFFIAAGVCLTGALGVILARNPVHSALMLVMTLFGIAVQFVAQEAHFLAAVQVIVYAGAIVVLFLFVIMLLGVDKAEDLGIEPISGQRPLTIIIGTSILGLVLTTLLISVNGPTGTLAPAPEPTTNTKNLGETLFTDHLFAVELTALLLTVAVVGAVSLARRIKGPLQPLPIVEAVSDEEIEVQETKDVE